MGWLFVPYLLLFFFHSNAVASGTKIDFSQLTVVQLNGAKSTIQDIKRKKTTYIKFWASWCQPCLEQMPHLQEVTELYGNDIDIIAVNIDLNESDDEIKQVIEKFNLTMPVVKDSHGELKQAFQFVGTPFHALINEQGQVLHTGHEADDLLDQRLDLLAKNRGSNISAMALGQAGNPHFDPSSLSQGRKTLLFTATWCDWYLEESRPDMSAACIKAQKNISSQDSHDQITIVSHMWTGDKEVAEFKSKYGINTPILLDTGGEAFFMFNVNSFPTFVVLENGKEVYRTSDYEDKRLYQ
jgi:thiol-disulfide isomerase/thioredoxin